MNHLKLAVLSSMLLLSGCGLLSPVQTQPPKSYVLTAVPSVTTHNHRQEVVMLVTQPDARPIYNTTQMAYTSHPYQVSYFGENQWAETPAQMLLPLMVQTLQKTHHFRAIVSPPYVGRYQYLLSTQLLKFQQDFMVNPSRFELVMRMQLTQVSTNQVVAVKQVDITIPMQDNTPYAGVVAANKATRVLLNELTEFTAKRT